MDEEVGPAMIHLKRGLKIGIWVAALVLICAAPSSALEPWEILVVSNANSPESLWLANYYMSKRGVPKGNLVKLRVNNAESCSRDVYDKKIRASVRRRIRELSGKSAIK